MGWQDLQKLLFVLVFLVAFSSIPNFASGKYPSRTLKLVEDGPDDVLWAVQVSDLHFSVHHPDRARSFKDIVGRALAIIRPSLVMITGDLTDGKSKDLLTMKQNFKEWSEYHNTMMDIVSMTGLPEDIFYDIRGNHDKFGVSFANSQFDFFSQKSISAQLNRTGNIKTITLMHSGRKHVFVVLDTSIAIGLRGPTNLFGHVTDELIEEIEAELSLLDNDDLVSTKVVFGHFPLSFTATTETGRQLKDVFKKHSVTAYLCGHLHTKFGRNLYKHYLEMPTNFKTYQQYFQFEAHYIRENQDCHQWDNQLIKEFWEWEMGDWRKSRVMRIIAIDKGHVSFTDFDYGMMVSPFDNSSLAVSTIVVPTFPLDSRMMQRMSSSLLCMCGFNSSSCSGPIRALVFSLATVTSVNAKIFDHVSGQFHLVMEVKMRKYSDKDERGTLYVSDWDWQRFIDPSPDRYWLQVQAIEDSGKSISTPLRPFSVSMKAAPLRWTWSEFVVMGIQWDLMYWPLLWFIFALILGLLFLPKYIDMYAGTGNQYDRWASEIFIFKNISKSSLFKVPVWILVQGSRNYLIWWCEIIYVAYLILLPWFHGQVLEEDRGTSYMSYKGWTISLPGIQGSYSGIGVPDIMVIVLPHLYLVVLPLLWVVAIFVSEKIAFQMHWDLKSEKKEGVRSKCKLSCILCGRWIRKLGLALCLLILWGHAKRCNALIHAYGAKGILFSPGFVWPVLFLMALAIWKTKC